MLTDILAVLIAFCTIILLFSLLVTAGVEAIHGLLNQRSFNLKIGMNQFKLDLRRNVRLKEFSDEQRRSIFVSLDLTIDDLLSNNTSRGMSAYLDQPQEISVEEMINSILSLTKNTLSEDEAKRLSIIIRERFKTAQTKMSRRFQRVSDHFSILLSFILAIIYQLNTPQLLSDLSANKDFRDAIVSYSENHFREMEDLPTPLTYSAIVEASVKKLIEKNQPMQEVLEELSGDGITNHRQAIQELRAVIKSNEDFDHLKPQYEKLLQDETLLAEKELYAAVKSTNTDLNRLNFSIMPKGTNYYSIKNDITTFENYFGILISAIFISLGAPFWFKNLKTIFTIRDYLNGPNKTSQK